MLLTQYQAPKTSRPLRASRQDRPPVNHPGLFLRHFLEIPTLRAGAKLSLYASMMCSRTWWHRERLQLFLFLRHETVIDVGVNISPKNRGDRSLALSNK